MCIKLPKKVVKTQHLQELKFHDFYGFRMCIQKHITGP
jgi:hypothetical protein